MDRASGGDAWIRRTEKAIERRQRKATAKNYDLVRDNALMLYQFQKMKAAYKAMKAEVERVRDEIEDVRETFGIKENLVWVYCLRFGLTNRQAGVLSLLMNRDFATKEQLEYAARADKEGRRDGAPDLSKVVLCKLRQRLAGHGIEIKTVWGEGVCMTPANKAKVQALTIGPFTPV
jgi:hypothetical protein